MWDGFVICVVVSCSHCFPVEPSNLCQHIMLQEHMRNNCCAPNYLAFLFFGMAGSQNLHAAVDYTLCDLLVSQF